jgi:hypothetical protein
MIIRNIVCSIAAEYKNLLNTARLATSDNNGEFYKAIGNLCDEISKLNKEIQCVVGCFKKKIAYIKDGQLFLNVIEPKSNNLKVLAE